MNTKSLVKGSVFLAIGIIIPYIFHTTGLPGTIFLPMHIPVLLCGFILGKKYGLVIGFITPYLNFLVSGMPPLYPVAIAMAFELATYGFLSGYLFKDKNYNMYVSLISAMLIGRAVSGTLNYFLLTLGGKPYALAIFLGNAFIKPVWGILIQLVLIPVIVKGLDKNTRMVNISE
ncbi:ECF transporter S component [Clostridium sp. MSJ-11]|uniref:ECF transporter S component n=1 Tax=Clostridium mobile TaxID=2841512 RepID=A0ABS6EL49_9CLOT|nr:ECF transporter S component [Clostridium mobile]MBU5485139.1 ECF transporter S component [Clostridium mobile]